jgi:hypothetical protein
MKKIYAAWIFIVGGLILALVFIGLNINMENKAYRSLENDMVEAAHKYIINNGIDLSNGESIKLQDDLLLRSEVLASMKTKDDECTGYVKVKNTGSELDAKAYIKCKNYTSKDYVE